MAGCEYYRDDTAPPASSMTPRTRIVILNSPQNTNGGLLAPSDVAAAAELITASEARVLSDEV